jgi:hypothetical protein
VERREQCRKARDFLFGTLALRGVMRPLPAEVNTILQKFWSEQKRTRVVNRILRELAA